MRASKYDQTEDKPMNLNLDNKKLKELMKDFYTLTEIKMVLFDSDYHEILSYPNGHCEFCAIMHGNPVTRKHCIECNQNSFDYCRRNSELMVYECHAGLIEAAAPLKDNGIIIGYVMFGQISDISSREELFTNLRNVCEKYQIYQPGYEEAFSKIKYKGHEQILAAAKILEACTFYVLLKEMVFMEKEQFLHKLNLYIMGHISEDISVKDLCNVFKVSRSRLYEAAKQYLGVGIAEYIKQKRIEAAKDYLKNSGNPITEISEKAGFSDYNYFCRVFKKTVGMPAKKYRKIYQQDVTD